MKEKMFRRIVSSVLLAFFLSLSGCGNIPFLPAGLGSSSSGSGSSGSSTSSETIVYDRATLLDLKRVTEDGVSKDWISVSPDGSMLLYCESLIPLKKWIDISEKRIKTFQIMLLRDAEKPAKTLLVTDSSVTPTWYSNETFVYSIIEGGVPKLIKSNIGGGGKVYISRNAVGTYDVHPSVRGNLILFDTEINRKNQIIRINDNGSDTTIMGEGESPSWHPRSPQKFLFIRNGDIFEMDLNTYQPTKLFGEPYFPSANPKYSSDGNYILFQKECLIRIINSKNGKASETRRWHVFVIKVDGTDLVQITNGNVDVFSPDWGKDNTVFFISNANDSTEIWTGKVNLTEIYKR